MDEKMATDAIEQLRQAQQERGEQLRALVMSWDTGKTFVEMLAEQTAEIEKGALEVNTDWGIMANEVYACYKSQPKMTAWDEPEEPEGPKIIVP